MSDSWRLVRFEPLDTVAVADPRGVGVGEVSFAADLLPSTLAGCLRTTALLESGWDFRAGTVQEKGAQHVGQAVGAIDGGLDFAFAGPFFADPMGTNDVYFPAPAALFTTAQGRLSCAEPWGACDDVLADDGLGGIGLLRMPDADAERLVGWVSGSALVQWLGEGRIPTRGDVRDAFFAVEPRWSHERDDQRGTVVEGRLYARNYLRMRAVRSGDCGSASMVGFVRTPVDVLEDGARLARLGGDSRMCRVTVGAQGETLDRIDKLRQSVLGAIEKSDGVVRILVYLATPGIFLSEHPWFPDVIAQAGGRVAAAAVASPFTVGGWDAKQKQPRPLYRAVPAGATYWTEFPEKKAAQDFVDEYLFATSLSDVYPEAGFGMALMGTWRPGTAG